MEDDKIEINQTPKRIVGKITKSIREKGRNRERANSTTLIDLWVGKEENRKRMRPKEEEKLDEIFKRSNKLKRSSVKSEKEGNEQEKDGEKKEDKAEEEGKEDKVEGEETKNACGLILEEMSE